MSLGTLVYALIVGLIPSLIWILFWLREDEHSEPKWLLIAAFMGGVVAVLGAVFAEKYIADIVSNQSLRYSLWAAAEEILKFVAVAVIALHTRFNDEPIDAMIYCIITALGFAAIENALFVMQPLESGSIATGLMTVNMRFIGATLVHIVSSALVGFALGYVFYRGIITKIFAVAIGLSLAIILHAMFNLSIINGTTGDTMKAFAWVWGAVVILIVLFEEIKAVQPKFKY
ncbi:MAG: PrsW family glutamic-type intramembrane protease [Candidatus Paceibacterota bacterium]|jgi:RsiW-degrading membrane proteinase PrsW (M82 family)